MTIAVTPSVRRIGAVAILFALALIVWNGVARPIVSTWQSDNREIGRMQTLIVRYRDLAQTEPALEKQLKALQHANATSRAFLAGGNANLILARLQSDVKGVVEAHHGQVHSVQALPVGDEAGFKKLGVRFEITTTLEDLTQIFYAIETQSPTLFLDNINIQASQALAPNPSATTPLTVQYDVFGYTRTKTP